MAQSPMFNYQAVLRDSANNLVANQNVKVTFSVKPAEGDYQDWTVKNVQTNNNGLVSLELEPLTNVDWNGATIKADFEVAGKHIVLNTPVAAVPYALQAGDVKITTAMITDYIGRSNAEDVDLIATAFGENTEFKRAFIDSLENYIKANYGIAKEILYDYLSQVTADDVNAAYDSARLVNQEVKNAVYDIIKRYLIDHRSQMVDVAEYYLSHVSLDEVEQLNDILFNSDAGNRVKQIVWEYFEVFLRSKGLVCDNPDWTLCDFATYVHDHAACPTIQSVNALRYGDFSDQTNIQVNRIYVEVFLEDVVPGRDLSTAVVTFTPTNGTDAIAVPYVSGNKFVLEQTGDNVTQEQQFTIKVQYSGCEVTQSGIFTNADN